ncbi:DUF4198 domain-containing protein [Sphingomonas sabuli]|uniref:DUF4198 domain-containing protein n=1 Tax=Sphingomonas sabuli TaxID=2764186 RepID=A0A7G9KZB5_9SPHN|nr:DUF4198 domain-containing protein [Sphingomonas sabuli]QNM81714.1 DUF4198 domain-containing protein [Sphingomonas sabuli]
MWAHDLWIQPQRFQAGVGDAVPMTFQIGHGDARQRWEGAEFLVLIEDLMVRSKRSLLADVRTDEAADLTVRFPTPGLHVVALQSKHFESNLPAIRFNDYAKTEGLALVIADRARNGTTNRAGVERYSRRGKTLVQVGPQTAANSALATRPVGLKLEIVPERNPYTLGADRNLPVHVLYRGKRLANATVKLTNLEFDAKPVKTIVTDKQGRASFRVPTVGTWLLNVIWSEPVKGDADADFDTTFSSLTWGYGQSRR